jgi:hypothetical protein
MDRKQTAWKKSRKFGDVYGGRELPKIANGIFRRVHSISPPSPLDKLPIYIVDNPSRDFFFPLEPDDIARELEYLPEADRSQITHIWLRRFKKSEYIAGELPFAEFICGSGVRAIILYPWQVDMRLFMSKKRPADRQLKRYSKYTTNLVETPDGWFLEWTLPELKNFYIEALLYHEIGHNVDWYRRRWTVANQDTLEEYANQYAFEYTSKRRLTYSQSPIPNPQSPIQNRSC